TRQHLAPQVGVVAGGIAAFENMREVGGVIARRYRRVVEPARAQCGRLEGRYSFRGWRPGGRDLVPGLIERCRRQVLGGSVTLVEFLSGDHPLEQLRRQRLAALIVARVVRHDGWLASPHLVVLRGVLDEV